DDHSAFARSEVLGRIEAEAHRITPVAVLQVTRTNRITLIVGADGVCRIFNHEQSVFTRQTPYRVHFASESRNVHGYDRPSSSGQFFSNRRRVDIAVLAYIGEHGRSSGMEDGVYGSAKSQRCCNDFVTGADP